MNNIIEREKNKFRRMTKCKIVNVMFNYMIAYGITVVV